MNLKGDFDRMTYIVLDLEWNQAYLQKAIAVQKRIGGHLRGEVIQIGAVKLDEQLRFAGSYSLIVRPKFFQKMQRHVARLTGISQEMVDRGCPLPEAIERFRRFCGEDCVFLTWGPDDIPLLKDNLWAHRIPSPWLDKVYDLQVIFNRQTDGVKCQRSLEYAMDYFDLPQDLPAHDALNDAYFTARVAAKLDIARGIREYATSHQSALQDVSFGESDIGQEGFASPEALMGDREIATMTCPLCSRVLKNDGKPLHTRGHKYQLIGRCEEHGNLLFTWRLSRNFDETWRARKLVERATAEDEETFRRKSEEHANRRKTRRRPRHRRGAAGKSEAGASEIQG